MLEKGEFEVVQHGDKRYILCSRLDMLPDIETELLQNAIFAYKCAPEKSNALKWLDMFQAHTKTTFATFSSKSGRPHVVFKARARCHYMVPHRMDKPRMKPSKRDSGCEMGLTISAIKSSSERQRSKLPTRGHGLRVACNGKPHNHRVRCAEALRHRRVSDTTNAILLKLFDKHHSPASALEMLKTILLKEHGDNYLVVVNDRHYLPDLPYVTRLYYKTHRERYGGLSRKEIRKLREANQLSTTSREKVITLALRPEHKTVKSEDAMTVSFEELGVLPGDWFTTEDEECYGGSADMDVSQEETIDDTGDDASAVVAARPGGGTSPADGTMCELGGTEPAAASPAAAEAAQRFRQWAARVSRQIAADASGHTGSVATSLMRCWERLPLTGDDTPEPSSLAVLGRPAVAGRTADPQPCSTVAVFQTDAPRNRSICVLRDAESAERLDDMINQQDVAWMTMSKSRRRI